MAYLIEVKIKIHLMMQYKYLDHYFLFTFLISLVSITPVTVFSIASQFLNSELNSQKCLSFSIVAQWSSGIILALGARGSNPG